MCSHLSVSGYICFEEARKEETKDRVGAKPHRAL